MMVVIDADHDYGDDGDDGDDGGGGDGSGDLCHPNNNAGNDDDVIHHSNP